MAVKAYIVRNVMTKREDGKRKIYIEEDLTPLFNVWRHENLFDAIRYNGYDHTSNDSAGEIGCEIDAWEEIKDCERKNFTEEEEEIAKKIDKYIEEECEIVLNCY